MALFKDSHIIFRSNKIPSLILPLLVILSKDENLTVRQTCFESLLDLRNQLNDSRLIEQVSEMIISLVKFGLSSRTSKFVSTIALHLPDLCQAFTSKEKLQIGIYNFIFSIV
jgi:hypothetical protein